MKKVFILCLVAVLLFVGIAQAAPTTFDLTIDDFLGLFIKINKIEKLGIKKDGLKDEGVQGEGEMASRTYSWVIKEDLSMLFTELIDTGNMSKVGITAPISEGGLGPLSLGIVMTFNPQMDQTECAKILLELLTKASDPGFYSYSKDVNGVTYSYTIQDKTQTFMASPGGWKHRSCTAFVKAAHGRSGWTDCFSSVIAWYRRMTGKDSKSWLSSDTHPTSVGGILKIIPECIEEPWAAIKCK